MSDDVDGPAAFGGPTDRAVRIDQMVYAWNQQSRGGRAGYFPIASTMNQRVTRRWDGLVGGLAELDESRVRHPPSALVYLVEGNEDTDVGNRIPDVALIRRIRLAGHAESRARVRAHVLIGRADILTEQLGLALYRGSPDTPDGFHSRGRLEPLLVTDLDEPRAAGERSLDSDARGYDPARLSRLITTVLARSGADKPFSVHVRTPDAAVLMWSVVRILQRVLIYRLTFSTHATAHDAGRAGPRFLFAPFAPGTPWGEESDRVTVDLEADTAVNPDVQAAARLLVSAYVADGVTGVNRLLDPDGPLGGERFHLDHPEIWCARLLGKRPPRPAPVPPPQPAPPPRPAPAGPPLPAAQVLVLFRRHEAQWWWGWVRNLADGGNPSGDPTDTVVTAVTGPLRLPPDGTAAHALRRELHRLAGLTMPSSDGTESATVRLDPAEFQRNRPVPSDRWALGAAPPGAAGHAAEPDPFASGRDGTVRAVLAWLLTSELAARPVRTDELPLEVSTQQHAANRANEALAAELARIAPVPAGADRLDEAEPTLTARVHEALGPSPSLAPGGDPADDAAARQLVEAMIEALRGLRPPPPDPPPPTPPAEAVDAHVRDRLGQEWSRWSTEQNPVDRLLVVFGIPLGSTDRLYPAAQFPVLDRLSAALTSPQSAGPPYRATAAVAAAESDPLRQAAQRMSAAVVDHHLPWDRQLASGGREDYEQAVFEAVSALQNQIVDLVEKLRTDLATPAPEPVTDLNRSYLVNQRAGHVGGVTRELLARFERPDWRPPFAEELARAVGEATIPQPAPVPSATEPGPGETTPPEIDQWTEESAAAKVVRLLRDTGAQGSLAFGLLVLLAPDPDHGPQNDQNAQLYRRAYQEIIDQGSAGLDARAGIVERLKAGTGRYYELLVARSTASGHAEKVIQAIASAYATPETTQTELGMLNQEMATRLLRPLRETRKDPARSLLDDYHRAGRPTGARAFALLAQHAPDLDANLDLVTDLGGADLTGTGLAMAAEAYFRRLDQASESDPACRDDLRRTTDRLVRLYRDRSEGYGEQLSTIAEIIRGAIEPGGPEPVAFSWLAASAVGIFLVLLLLVHAIVGAAT